MVIGDVLVDRGLRCPPNDWCPSAVVWGKSTSWTENAVLDPSGPPLSHAINEQRDAVAQALLEHVRHCLLVIAHRARNTPILPQWMMKNIEHRGRTHPPNHSTLHVVYRDLRQANHSHPKDGTTLRNRFHPTRSAPPFKVEHSTREHLLTPKERTDVQPTLWNRKFPSRCVHEFHHRRTVAYLDFCSGDAKAVTSQSQPPLTPLASSQRTWRSARSSRPGGT